MRVHPAFARAGVVGHFEKSCWHKHLVLADALCRTLKQRPSNHEHIALGLAHVAQGVLLDLQSGAVVVAGIQ